MTTKEKRISDLKDFAIVANLVFGFLVFTGGLEYMVDMFRGIPRPSNLRPSRVCLHEHNHRCVLSEEVEPSSFYDE